MSIGTFKEIELNSGVKVTVDFLGYVYLNGLVLTKIDKRYNFDKFESLVKNDNTLRLLIDEFLSAQKLSKLLNKKEDEIRKTIEKLLSKTHGKKLEKFYYDGVCYGMFLVRYPNKTIYNSRHLVLESIDTTHNFSCFLAQFDRVINTFYPNLRIKVTDYGYFVSISVNKYDLIVSDNVDLKSVLSFLSKLKKDRFYHVMEMFNEFVEIKTQKERVCVLFKAIKHRIKELIRQSKT